MNMMFVIIRSKCFCFRIQLSHFIVQLTTARGLNDGPEYDCKGEYIWFNSVRTGRMQAWRMKADGSEQTQMTFDEHWNTWFPHISPDLKKVVMVAYTEVDVKPGGQGTVNVNSWAPDSKRFAFVIYEK